jgi:hypothetical protein
MNDMHWLSHARLEGTYHVVWRPKCPGQPLSTDFPCKNCMFKIPISYIYQRLSWFVGLSFSMGTHNGHQSERAETVLR